MSYDVNMSLKYNGRQNQRYWSSSGAFQHADKRKRSNRGILNPKTDTEPASLPERHARCRMAAASAPLLEETEIHTQSERTSAPKHHLACLDDRPIKPGQGQSSVHKSWK